MSKDSGNSRKSTGIADFIFELDNLLRTIKAKNNKDLARRIGVSEDLVYAWRQGRSRPSMETALELGKLESAATKMEVVAACRKWLALANREKKLTNDEIRTVVERVRPEDPPFSEGLINAVAPLGKLILNLQQPLNPELKARLNNMMVCKLSQIAGRFFLESWLESGTNNRGTALFLWDFDLESKHEVELKLDRLFANWVKPLFGNPKYNLTLAGCFVCQRRKQESEELPKPCRTALESLLAACRQVDPAFQLYFTTALDPLAADLWFFNTALSGEVAKEVRGRLLEEPRMLKDLINVHGTNDLRQHIEDWTTMVVELAEKKVFRFLRSRHIDFESGGLHPKLDKVEGCRIWEKLSA